MPNDFYERVWAVVRLVPKGRVTTYGAIAYYLGSGGSSRMVGWAMNNAHGQTPQVPAHRVVNKSGLLTGKFHFENEYMMQELLQSEGVTVLQNQVCDFEKCFWDPAENLPEGGY